MTSHVSGNPSSVVWEGGIHFVQRDSTVRSAADVALLG